MKSALANDDGVAHLILRVETDPIQRGGVRASDGLPKNAGALKLGNPVYRLR